MDEKKRTRTIGATASAGVLALALVGLFLAIRASGESSAAKPAERAAASMPRAASTGSSTIAVAFKLDSRLTQSLYMGDRWVSPPTYQHAAQVGESATLEARAEVVGSEAAPTPARLTWKPADPEMVTVSPATGNQVRITVRRAGQSHVKLAYGGASRDLVVKAVQQNGIWRVDVVQ